MIRKVADKYKTFPVQVRASFWFLICSFMQKGITTITTPIFTRLLSTSEYGQYSVFNSWLSMITIFVTLQLTSGVYTQGLVKFDTERAVFASSLQGLSLTLVLAWTIVYLLFKEFWNAVFSLTTVQMLAMLLMLWTTSVFGFWAAEQRVEYKYQKLVFVTLLVSIAKPVVGIIFVILANDKVTARILGLVLVEVIAYTGLFFAQMGKGKVFFSSKFWKYALLFNLPLIPHYLAQNVLNSSDRIMIEKMVGEDAAGIYSLAYSISLIMTLFNSALSQTISPWMYQKIKEKNVGDIANIAYISMTLVAALNLLLIAFAPEIVAVFAPKEYSDAIWVVPPVAMSVFFMFCYDYFARFEFYYEKRNFILIASIGGAVLNLVLNYLFIPLYGYCAAGYTTLFCYIIYDIGHYLCMRKICKDYLNGIKVYDVSRIVSITLGFMLIGFLLLVTYNVIVLRYIIVMISVVLIVAMRKPIFKCMETIVDMKRTK